MSKEEAEDMEAPARKYKDKAMFHLNEGAETMPGLQMTFENGYSVSIQWHYGAYSSVRRTTSNESPNAEVAVFDPTGKFVPLEEYDDVRGHQSPDQVAALIRVVTRFRYDEQSGRHEGGLSLAHVDEFNLDKMNTEVANHKLQKADA